MTEEQGERVHELKEKLWVQVHDLVDDVLDGEDPDVQELVRDQLTEQFRFWKRRHEK